jgi:hypothetical protein
MLEVIFDLVRLALPIILIVAIWKHYKDTRGF